MLCVIPTLCNSFERDGLVVGTPPLLTWPMVLLRLPSFQHTWVCSRSSHRLWDMPCSPWSKGRCPSVCPLAGTLHRSWNSRNMENEGLRLIFHRISHLSQHTKYIGTMIHTYRFRLRLCNCFYVAESITALSIVTIRTTGKTPHDDLLSEQLILVQNVGFDWLTNYSAPSYFF